MNDGHRLWGRCLTANHDDSSEENLTLRYKSQEIDNKLRVEHAIRIGDPPARVRPQLLEAAAAVEPPERSRHRSPCDGRDANGTRYRQDAERLR